ncbi:hypothetical protein ACHWQZ_G000784 [Mnemiopsis leidyi]
MVPDTTVQEKKSCSCEHSTTLFWCGPGKNIPVLHFRPDVCLYKNTECSCNKMVSSGVGLTYKFVKTECRLLRTLLEGHGFREIHQNSNDFNLMWCGCHVKPYTLRGLTELQKVNHFPRSYEITRKDRMYKNYMRMRQTMGAKHFDFLPVTYVLPSEVNEFYSTFQRERGFWIAKPVASSRGRGISIISHPNQINLEEQVVVCKYISNPLLVDGFKFDLRIYVMVTSFDPLRVYVFNEGLARFSTVRYDGSPLNLNNMFMHLTNYSVNKKNAGYVKCSDPDIEDYGNKWSMSALLRYLKSEGYDTATMMMRVEDLIIKTLLSAEVPIANACRMFLPHRENCFELFGFDVIFDEDRKPWLLEVNLSPSLACESPLDLKIKSNLVSHMLTLAGVVALDPYSRREYGNGRKKSAVNGSYSLSVDGTNAAPLSNEDLRLVRQTKEEFVRKGAFSRIFPSEDSWDLYSQFLENKTHYNFMLHSQLYPNRSREKSRPSSAVISMNKFRDMNSSTNKAANQNTIYTGIRERYIRYEKSLQPLGTVEDYPPEALVDTITPDFSLPDDVTDITKDSDTVEETSSDAKKQTKAKGQRTKSAKGERSTTYTKTEEKTEEKPSNPEEPTAPNPPPPEVEPEPPFNPQVIVEKASSLSKVQAREVFATYLTKLQGNLNEDSGSEQTEDVYEGQMDTVVRFLKRASANLHLQVFRVIVPSKKLPISDQRRILAKELGDFIHIYGKETQQIAQKARMRKLLLQSRDDTDVVSEKDLQQFLSLVEEPDLESVLTSYTSTHPSSALFLGEVKHEDINSLIRRKTARGKQGGNNQAATTEENTSDSKPRSTCPKETTSTPASSQTPSNDQSRVTAAETEKVEQSREQSRASQSLTKSGSKQSMGTVSSKQSATSSGYCSYISSSAGDSVGHSRPKTATAGVSRTVINEALNRLNKRSDQKKTSVVSDDSTAKTKGRMMKRWSSGASNSPYMASVSSTTITSLPNRTRTRNSARGPPRPGSIRKSQSHDNSHQVTSRDKSQSRDARAGSARDKSRVGARSAGAISKKSTVSASDNTLIVAREEDQISRKTAANLKNPRSKRFVQSVWTEEFCKLMDLRMYSH